MWVFIKCKTENLVKNIGYIHFYANHPWRQVLNHLLFWIILFNGHKLYSGLIPLQSLIWSNQITIIFSQMMKLLKTPQPGSRFCRHSKFLHRKWLESAISLLNSFQMSWRKWDDQHFLKVPSSNSKKWILSLIYLVLPCII